MTTRWTVNIPYLPNPLLKSSSRPQWWGLLSKAKREDQLKAESAIADSFVQAFGHKKVGGRASLGMPWNCATLSIKVYVATSHVRDLDNYISMCKGFIDGAVGKIVTDDSSKVIQKLDLQIIKDKALSPLTQMIFTRCKHAAI